MQPSERARSEDGTESTRTALRPSSQARPEDATESTRTAPSSQILKAPPVSDSDSGIDAGERKPAEFVCILPSYEDDEAIDGNGDEEKSLKCARCDETFNSAATLIRHMKTHERLFECEHCTATFRFRSSFKMHKDYFHTGWIRGEPRRRRARSPTTDSTEGMPRLRRPSSVKSEGLDPDDYEYDDGGEESGRKKIFKCTRCEKRFTSTTLLRIHINQHTGAKPFRCDLCDRKYSSKGSLVAHQKWNHDDE